MSKQGSSLANNPRVVAAVLGLLALVILFNLRALLPESASSGAHGSQEPTGLAPPPDLMTVSKTVDASTRSGDPADPRRGLQAGAVSRNPFQCLKTTQVSQARLPASPAQSRSRDRGELACSAIFIVDGAPSAIVGGRAVAEGDRLSRYRVLRITAEGVTLAAGGAETFLPVEQSRSGGVVGAPVALGQ